MNADAFSRDYQEHLIARLMQDGFVSKVASFLEPDIFDVDLVPVVEFILKTFRKHGNAPSKAQVLQYVPQTRFPAIPKKSPMKLDVEAVYEFVKARRVRRALMESNQLLLQGDTVGAVAELNRAGRKFLTTEDTQTFDFFNSEDIQNTRGRGMSFGSIPTLDHATGGLCKGEMALVMAATNGGKTSWLIHVAALAVAEGYNVFFASLEMLAHSMKMRFEAKFKDMRIPKRSRGHLHIYCTSPHTVSPPRLSSRIDQQDKTPDVIIIDSGDLMLPPRKWGSQWEEEKDTFEGIKALALDHQAMLWVATQANRPGYSREVIGLSNVKGSIGKVQIVDHVITINQDENEQMADEETGMSSVRIYLAKCRFGPRGAMASVNAHFETSTFIEEDLDVL